MSVQAMPPTHLTFGTIAKGNGAYTYCLLKMQGGEMISYTPLIPAFYPQIAEDFGFVQPKNVTKVVAEKDKTKLTERLKHLVHDLVQGAQLLSEAVPNIIEAGMCAASLKGRVVCSDETLDRRFLLLPLGDEKENEAVFPHLRLGVDYWVEKLAQEQLDNHFYLLVNKAMIAKVAARVEQLRQNQSK